MADITTTGSVGIGTATPNSALTIANNVSGGGPDSSYGSYQALLYDAGTANTSYGLGVEPFYLWFNSNGGYKFYTNNAATVAISSSGFVGIGTSSPSYPLDISGSVRATGTMYAPAFTVTSDKRLKRKIATLSSDCIKLVQELRPVSFEWKHSLDESMEGKQFGFVAHEVEEVLPSAVVTQVDEKKSKGIKYNEIVVLLTRAIQEQQTRIDALEAKLVGLKSQPSDGFEA